ncbi:BTB And Kelch, partial [Ostertagia ostertagi]
MNTSNCLGIRAFADTYACGELLRCANKYILHNFKDVIGTDEFYNLPGKQLVKLISSEELQVPSEDQVFKAVVEWVRFDLPARQQLFPQLFEHVRLPLCHSGFLVNTVSKEALVKANAACRNLVDEAKDYQLLQFSTHERPSIQESRTRPRKVLTGEILYV